MDKSEIIVSIRKKIINVFEEQIHERTNIFEEEKERSPRSWYCSHQERKLTKLISLESCIETFLEKVENYLAEETITDKDLVYINVYAEWGNGEPFVNIFVNIFILTAKQFIKLQLIMEGDINKIEHKIPHDIKESIAKEDRVSIYFYGSTYPQIIYVDDYKSAIHLQKHLRNPTYNYQPK